MGNTESTIPGDGYSGFHVLKVEENSPAHKAGLQAFFDYIVEINGEPLFHESEAIVDILRKNQDKQITMTVYSCITKNCRQVSTVLESNWGGKGLLGASIRFCPFEGANENVWHVLNVLPRSPAAMAKLNSDSDYIIGADAVLTSRDDLYDLINEHDGKAIKLYVYSSLTQKCREVHLTPNSNWGGQGLLGCEFGYGYLHRIPTSDNASEETPASDITKASMAGPVEMGQIPGFAPPTYTESANGKSASMQHEHDHHGHGHSHEGGGCCPSETAPPVKPMIPPPNSTIQSFFMPPGPPMHQSYLSTETNTTPSAVYRSPPAEQLMPQGPPQPSIPPMANQASMPGMAYPYYPGFDAQPMMYGQPPQPPAATPQMMTMPMPMDQQHAMQPMMYPAYPSPYYATHLQQQQPQMPMPGMSQPQIFPQYSA